MFEYIFNVFLGYSLLIIGLWGIATIAVEWMLWKKKSRVRLASEQRQGQRKLYIHSIADDFATVKSEVSK